MLTRIIASAAMAVFMVGCARSMAVERVQMRDNELTCNQLLAEIQEAERFRRSAEDNKGFTGTNTAAVLFFWPALFMTYSDANEAIRAADERKAHLTRLYNEENCEMDKERGQTNPIATDSHIEARLQELKGLLDQGLISPDEYWQKREEILKDL
jgi:hypothetical protein